MSAPTGHTSRTGSVDVTSSCMDVDDECADAWRRDASRDRAADAGLHHWGAWCTGRLGTAALLAATVLMLGAATASAAGPVTVSPAPGTPDASPRTQISILGVAPKQIRSIKVSGSASGLLRGAFHDYSGRRGASFVPSRPLDQGEDVSVVLRIAGRKPIRWSFAVATLASTPPVLNILKLQPAKLDHFVSEPGLLAPRISVLRRGSVGGDIFLTPLPSPEIHPESNNALTINPVGPGGPMIIDSRGRLVWFHQLAPPEVATNLRIEQLHGHDVLTWWQGEVTIAAYGIGEGVIADGSYRTLHVVHAGNGYSADLHEFRLTPSGDALLTVNSLVRVHLPGTPAPARSLVLDSIVQEVDIRTGLVVWEWHSLGHIPLADSYATPATSAYFDAYHLNSIQPLAGDRMLISARDTSAVYDIDRATGRIVWTLGGKASSFRLGPGARFYFQHDAQLTPGNRVSLFDDEGGPPTFGPAPRGLVLALDIHRHTARVVRQYKRPGNDTHSNSEGSVQAIPGGAFVDFGSERFFSAFSPGGRLTFDASLPKDDGSYRAFAFPWNARPRTRPKAVAQRAGSGNLSIYVSWNGATGVARWRALARGGSGSLKALRSVADRGFETKIELSSAAGTFIVQALDARGRVLASSSAVHPS